MLLERTPNYNPKRRREIREGVDDRLYLTKKPRRESLEDEDDLVIDFDDDISGFECDDMEYRKPTSPVKPSSQSSNVMPLLQEINNRLIHIEDMLRGNSQKVTVTTQSTAPSIQEMNEAIAQGDIMGRLTPPSNVVPTGTMLGEIQSVLSQQASVGGDAATAQAANDVVDVCSLNTSAYDDEVPNFE